MVGTDDEVVEAVRKGMQELFDRTHFSPDTRATLDSTGLPQRTVRVIDADIRLLGSFDLDLSHGPYANSPPLVQAALRRHWVYRHRDGRVLALSLPHRSQLRALGYADVHALIERHEDPN